MSVGTVILLNGTSSSGKTSTAKALQAILDAPYEHFDIDTFDFQSSPCPDTAPAPFRPKQHHYLNSALARAAAGVNVILEYIFREPAQVDAWARMSAGARVYFVCLYCPRAELEQRERKRGDRRIGQAGSQFEQVYAPRAYDLEIDTSRTTDPEECAQRIRDFMLAHPEPTAFRHRSAADTERQHSREC